MPGKITTVQARDNFFEVINRVAYGKERIIITRRGKGLAAILPIEDLSELDDLENRLKAEAVRRAWAEQGKRKPGSWERVKKKLELK